MALFGRKKKEFNPNDVEIPEFNHDDFQKSISDIIGKGSQDVKQIEITLKDESPMRVFVENGKISFAYSEKYPLDLTTRLYWAEEEVASSKNLQSILHSTDNYFEIYNRVDAEEPKSVSDKIKEIYRNYTLSTLSIGREIGIKQLYIEMMIDTNVVHMIRSANFISISPNNLDKALDFAEDAETTAYKAISSSDYSEVHLTVNPLFIHEDGTKSPVEINDGETDEERLVIAAAEASTTLQNVKDNSSGFQWQDVLQATADLIYSNKIEMEDLGEEDEDEILLEIEPEEDELDLSHIIEEEAEEAELEDQLGLELLLDEANEEEVESETTEDKELSPIGSKFNISWDLDEIEKENPDEFSDDDALTTEELASFDEVDFASLNDEPDNFSTPGLDPKISPIVENIFEKATFADETQRLFDEIVSSAQMNDKIEEEVARQDKVIQSRIDQYLEGTYEYEDTSLQIGINTGLYKNELLEEEKIEEDSPETVELRHQLDNNRKISNERFFNIEAIESSRHMKNLTRRSILVSLEENVHHLVEAIENSSGNINQEELTKFSLAIEDKIDGIDTVRNKALHLASDDKELAEIANPAYFESPEAMMNNSPIFSQLAKDLDVDLDKIKNLNKRVTVQNRIEENSFEISG